MFFNGGQHRLGRSFWGSRQRKKKKEYSLIGKIGSFKLQILSSSLSALDLPEFSALRIRLTRFLNLIGKVCF